MKRPIIGITMGDPAGNGSELTAKALSNTNLYQTCRPVVIGDAACMEDAVRIAGKQGQVSIHAIQNIQEAAFTAGTIDVYHMGLVLSLIHI